MGIRKIISVISATALVFSMFAGIGTDNRVANAAVNAQLPQVTGLYVAEHFDWSDGGNRTVLTEQDAAGNTIPVNRDGEQICWNDQDNPDYLTAGVREGWGLRFEKYDEKWFDYIENGRVTHVKPEDLTITNLDGTPCNDIIISTHSEDPRIAAFDVRALGKYLITYKGATVNNKMVAEFSLNTGFYDSQTMTLDGYRKGDVTVIRGKTKELYFHMTDNWEYAGFKIEDEDNVIVRYWDREADREVEIHGNDVLDYITVTKVSENDVHHLIYKITVKKDINVGDWMNVRFEYHKYNIINPEECWKEDRDINLQFRDTGVLYAAESDSLYVKNGKYAFPANVEYREDAWIGAGGLDQPIYTQFKYSDENGELQNVTDLSKISVFRTWWDEEAEKDMYEKAPNGLVKIEKAYAGSDVVKITYSGTLPEDWVEFVVMYNKENAPSGDFSRINLGFIAANHSEVMTSSKTLVSDANYLKEIHTDGESDAVFYLAAASDMGFYTVDGVEISGIRFFDENGKDLSSKVSFNNNVQLTEANNRNLIFASKVTIAKDALKACSKLIIDYQVTNTRPGRGQAVDNGNLSVYIFYEPKAAQPTAKPTATPAATPGVKKGDKATVNGYSYKVTAVGKSNTVTCTKGRKNAKSISIPDTVKIKGVAFKVTEIAANACKGNKKATSITVGKNVITIGANAFNGCGAVTKITIKGTALKKIKGGAFKCGSKKTKATVPKTKKNLYKKLLGKGGYKGKVK
ncbi:MAG: leucine-rich repeat domain-containing protein [Lachnospiraceae bacterium]|nr:leucine-rich repeat domain-containing protein [Lachnospiraceae bacterium]